MKTGANFWSMILWAVLIVAISVPFCMLGERYVERNMIIVGTKVVQYIYGSSRP